MIFPEEFLEELRNDPMSGTIRLVRIVREHFNQDTKGWTDAEYDALLEAYALVLEIVASGILNITEPEFDISGSRDDDCKLINQYLGALEDYCISEASKLKVQSLRSHFKAAIGSGFTYEFSQGDLQRAQVLINQVRDLIAEANGLEKDHKRRLLNRVEKLQSELHKKVSDLDRFWGLIGDAGVVLGKLGEDAKPIVDRIKEIADIVWQTQSRAEELPSGTRPPLLADKSISDDSEV